jgi:hypothetical protein
MELSIVKSLYPLDNESDYFSFCDYQPLLESFGEILLQVDDSDYQGDSRLILKKGESYGFFIFGWGSCSGCDWLQGCNSYEEVEELRQDLVNKIKWFNAKEMLFFLETHDWQGNYYWHEEETKEFVSQAKELMSSIAGETT